MTDIPSKSVGEPSSSRSVLRETKPPPSKFRLKSDVDTQIDSLFSPTCFSRTSVQGLRTSLPATRLSSNWKKLTQSALLYRKLDRVNVLGSETTGHTGCVCFILYSWFTLNISSPCGPPDASMLWVGRETGSYCWAEAMIQRAYYSVYFGSVPLCSHTRTILRCD